MTRKSIAALLGVAAIASIWLFWLFWPSGNDRGDSRIDTEPVERGGPGDPGTTPGS